MILYHGSRTGGIHTLEPRQADHDRPYLYLTTLETVAALYLCNAVEKPWYWFPYGFRKGAPDVPVYDELYPNALKEVSQGVSGWIYVVEAEEDEVIPFPGNPCARLGTKPLSVRKCISVPDAYQHLCDYIRRGRLEVTRFADMSDRDLKLYDRMILDYLRRKEMHRIPDCSYARFVREKFPEVWDEYMQTVRAR